MSLFHPNVSISQTFKQALSQLTFALKCFCNQQSVLLQYHVWCSNSIFSASIFAICPSFSSLFDLCPWHCTWSLKWVNVLWLMKHGIGNRGSGWVKVGFTGNRLLLSKREPKGRFQIGLGMEVYLKLDPLINFTYSFWSKMSGFSFL